MPGWYGVANVKWLAEIHLQENRFLGNSRRGGTARSAPWAARRGCGSQTQFVETEVTRINLKSLIRSRAQDRRRRHAVLGVVLNDGSPLRSVEVKVDEPVAAGAVRRGQHAVFVEALHLPVDRRHARRAYARVAGHRRHRGGAADRRRVGAQADVPRRQLAVPAQGQGGLTRRRCCRCARSSSATPMPATPGPPTAYAASNCALR